MSQWRSGTFWASFVFGWFVTVIFLAVLIAVLGSEEMTEGEGVVAMVAGQVLAVAAGYAHGRRQFERGERGRRAGFPVVMKEGERPGGG